MNDNQTSSTSDDDIEMTDKKQSQQQITKPNPFNSIFTIRPPTQNRKLKKRKKLKSRKDSLNEG